MMPRLLLMMAACCVLVASEVAAQSHPHAGCMVVQGRRAHDFGRMEQTETVEHTFVLKNTCKETIVIEDAKTSCGCTAAVVSEKTVPPGGTARINVRFTPPTGSAGLVTKSVSVYERGQPASPLVDMTISATVRTDLTLVPTLARFGDGTPGKPVTATVTLQNTSDRAIGIERSINTMTMYAGDVGGTVGGNAMPIPHDQVKIEPADLYLKPGEKREVRITVTPPVAGQLYGAIEFKSPKARVFLSLSGVIGGMAGTAGEVGAAGSVGTAPKKSAPMKRTPTPRKGR